MTIKQTTPFKIVRYCPAVTALLSNKKLFLPLFRKGLNVEKELHVTCEVEWIGHSACNVKFDKGHKKLM